MMKSRTKLDMELRRVASTVRVDFVGESQSSRGRRALGRGLDTPDLSVPSARSPKLARVEAALFVSAEPLSTRRIADAANLEDAAEARALVLQLKALYDADGSAFTLESIAGGWQLCTRAEYADWLEKMHPNRQSSRLSQPAIETLAVVAYRQPVLRADIESIRGVACGEMLRQLIERGLVRIVGHHDSLGRPLLYGTTRRFLELFGLADLANLPIAEQLRRPAHSKSSHGTAVSASQLLSDQNPAVEQRSADAPT